MSSHGDEHMDINNKNNLEGNPVHSCLIVFHFRQILRALGERAQ